MNLIADKLDIVSNIDERPYVCLNPAFTIPVVENTNIDAHRDLLRKVVSGMMLQFGAMAINPNNDPENEGNIGIISLINPYEDENTQFMLLGIPVEGKPNTFEINGVTSLSKKDEESNGCRIPFGEKDATEIFDAMNLEENFDIFLNDFIESVKMIYSGILPSIY